MPSSPKSSSSKSETKLVKELADILDASGLAEIEYETEAVSIRLSRVTGAVPVAATTPPPVAAPAAPVAAPVAEAPSANPASHPGAVTSPMVGTVYTSPEPDAPAFISEGDTVKAGQTLFIVEAMKVMNPITAPKAGKISNILVQNAQPVEFGDILIIFE